MNNGNIKLTKGLGQYPQPNYYLLKKSTYIHYKIHKHDLKLQLRDFHAKEKSYFGILFYNKTKE